MQCCKLFHCTLFVACSSTPKRSCPRRRIHGHSPKTKNSEYYQVRWPAGECSALPSVLDHVTTVLDFRDCWTLEWIHLGLSRSYY
jgi:hypothetical protein